MTNSDFQSVNKLNYRKGREIFAILKPLFNLAVFFLKMFPAGCCEWFLRLTRYVTGKFGIGLRYVILKRLARECGDNVSVHDSVFLKDIKNLKLGNNISIHPLCYIDAQGGISIGNDVSIAHNVSILSFEHDYSNINMPIKDAPCIPKEIIIEKDVWIGAGVRILGGVQIGYGSVIGAGAVVTKDIPSFVVAAGVPARPIKDRRPANK